MQAQPAAVSNDETRWSVPHNFMKARGIYDSSMCEFSRGKYGFRYVCGFREIASSNLSPSQNLLREVHLHKVTEFANVTEGINSIILIDQSIEDIIEIKCD